MSLLRGFILAIFCSASGFIQASLLETPIRIAETKKNQIASGSNVRSLIVFSNYLYFFADDSFGDNALWRLGRASNNLEKIYSFGIDEEGGQIAATDTLLFFTSESGDLWVYNREQSKSTLLIRNWGAVIIDNISLLGDGVIFSVSHTHRTEVWVSDGTESGTYQIKEIFNSISTSIAKSPIFSGDFPPRYPELSSFTKVNEMIYFLAENTIHGTELWLSDGTETGTKMVKDIVPGEKSSSPSSLTKFGDVVIFFAKDEDGKPALWKSDGTALGTVVVKDFSGISGKVSPSLIVNVDKRVYFKLNINTKPSEFSLLGSIHDELWVSDGTTGGTERVKQFGSYKDKRSQQFSFLDLIKGKLYFNARSDHSFLSGMWRSDGTPEGTVEIETLEYGIDACNDVYQRIDKRLYYSFADKSAQTGSCIAGFDHYIRGEEFTFFDGKMFFVNAVDSNERNALWHTDGTEAGTDIAAVTNFQYSAGKKGYTKYFLESEAIDEQFYFVGSENVNHELMVTNGTEKGTYVIKDIFPGERSSYPKFLTKHKSYIYFRARDDVYGSELWRSDGTAEGTNIVKDINLNKSALPSELISTDDYLYFTAIDVEHGRELWRTDGTVEGTKLVKDFIQGEKSSNPNILGSINNRVLVSLNNSRELWAANDIGKATQLLNISSRLPENNIKDFTIAGRHAYFWTDYNYSKGMPPQLWVTDGTTSGTQVIAENLKGRLTSLTPVGDKLYYVVNGSIGGAKLWGTDGTKDGTYEIKPEDGEFGYFTKLISSGSSLYFGGSIVSSIDSKEMLIKIDTITNGLHLLGFTFGKPYEAYGLNDRLYFYKDKEGALWVTGGTEYDSNLLVTDSLGDVYTVNHIVVENSLILFNRNQDGTREIVRIDGDKALTKAFVGEFTNFVEMKVNYSSSHVYFYTEKHAGDLDLWAFAYKEIASNDENVSPMPSEAEETSENTQGGFLDDESSEAVLEESPTIIISDVTNINSSEQQTRSPDVSSPEVVVAEDESVQTISSDVSENEQRNEPGGGGGQLGAFLMLVLLLAIVRRYRCNLRQLF